jgi:CspA family cold shock protein
VAEGVIKRLVMDRGFGFIRTDSGEELFFHRSHVQGVAFEALAERQRVSFTEGRGPKGPVAENVCPA